MAVLTRSALEGSPLADLHALASELGIDGFRRLRKADLVDVILTRQGGEDDSVSDSDETIDAVATAQDDGADEDKPPARRARGSRGGRARRTRDADADADTDDAPAPDAADAPAPRARAARERKPREDRDARERKPREDRDDRERKPREDREDRIAEGVVELLGNGSGFLRVSPPEPTDDDVYISAAQVRRCELVSGDAITGPVRAPRRSERFPSLIRIDTINGKPADEVAEGTHFEDLPATWPVARFELGSDDATLKAIEWLTPIGRGSRVTISGGPHSGKSEALRLLAGALTAIDGVEVSIALAGVRPEETTDWPVEPAATATFAASADAQNQAIERTLDTAKRIAARGGDAVVLVDTLDSVDQRLARRALAAARNIADGGSLTVIAVASAPIGGETTVIALDAGLARTGRFPALDLVASGTLHADLLVGDAGADAISEARSKLG